MTVKWMLIPTLGALLFTSPILASGSQKQGSGKHKVETHTYKVDPSHSRLGFKVPHLGITSVSGYFKNFEGSLTFEGGKPVAAEATLNVSSVFTDNEKRDDHLKADDFFGEKSHPVIKFKSKKVIVKGKDITVMGDLTIRDITKTITLKGTFGGTVYIEAWKVHKAGLSLKGSINRQDFGLKFSKFLGTGEAMVGDKVELVIDLEANRS
jgi:polyisoprenoid-binding protein YceI